MSESRADRIARMESYLDESKKAAEELKLSLDGYAKVRKKIKKLEEYYTGKQWLADYEADEAGKLPACLKRGVLSEDAINDLLDEIRELTHNMSDLTKEMK